MPLLITDPIDWKLDADNNLVMPLEYVRGMEAIVQAIRIRLQMFQGEWFLNLDIGIPYLEDPDGGVSEEEAILGQKFDPVKVRAAFRREILSVPGVEGVTKLETRFDGDSRTMFVTIIVSTIFGDTPEDTIALRVGV